MTFLETRGLAAGYGSRVVVQGVNLSCDTGDIVSLLGANGSGKSTVLRAIFGLCRTFGGQVSVGGHALQGGDPSAALRLGVGILLQGEAIFPSLSVRENILVGLKGNRRSLQDRLDDAVSLFPEIRPMMSKLGGLLSGGQRQIVGVCRLLAAEARLLLLDEPGAGLSPSLLERVLVRLGEVAAARGIAVLMAEQNVGPALAISQRVVVLREGEQVHYGPSAGLDLDSLAALMLDLGTGGVESA